MRAFCAALAACAVFLPATLLADTVSLKVVDPKDGFELSYQASWVRTAKAGERYWLCDRPLWVGTGVGPKISRLYQAGYRVEMVTDDRALDGKLEAGDAKAGAADAKKDDAAAKSDAAAKQVICTLNDPSKAEDAKPGDSKEKAAAGASH